MNHRSTRFHKPFSTVLALQLVAAASQYCSLFREPELVRRCHVLAAVQSEGTKTKRKNDEFETLKSLEDFKP